MIQPIDLQFLINGAYRSADLDRSSSFSMNMSRDELTNPAITKVQFSSQISLPRTQNNDHLFSSLFKIDSVVLHYNPLKRTDFLLYLNGTIYESGYMSVEEVTRNAYKIRLYGGLGDYFYTMNEVSDDRDMRLSQLDFGKLFKHDINKNMVLDQWRYGNSVTGSYYDHATEKETRNEPILRYAMCYQGKYEDFDNNSVADQLTGTEEVVWESKGKTNLSPDLNEHHRSFKTEDSVTGDSETQHYGEYRSYYQRPAIRFKVLYNKILDTMKQPENGGWKTELDKTFFNTFNPYWDNLWMIMPPYDTSENNGGIAYNLSVDESKYGYGGSDIIEGTDKNYEKRIELDTSFNDSEIPLNQDTKFIFNLPFTFKNYIIKGDRDHRLYKNIRINIKIYAEITIDKHTHTVPIKYNGTADSVSFIRRQDRVGGNLTEIKIAKTPADYYFWYSPIVEDRPEPYTYTFSGTHTFTAEEMTANPKIKIFMKFDGGTGWSRTKGNEERNVQLVPVLGDDYIFNVGGVANDNLRSGSEISYSDIMRSGKTCFDLLHSYSKLFGLIYVKDTLRKKVSIMTRNTFFASRKKTDWTNKIDYSKEDITKPVPFTYANGLFKWNDTGSKYEEMYLASTNKEYGSKRYYTNYEFSDSTMNWLDGIIFDNCIVATDYSQYYLDRDATMYKDNKTLPHLQDASGEGIDASFPLVFYNGVSEELKVPFAISDDTEAMLVYGYSWTNKNIQTCRRYPLFSRMTEVNAKQYSLNFGRPYTVYNDNEVPNNGNSKEEDETIYSLFWGKYLEDKFSKNNRVKTCYVFLDPSEVQNNLFNQFIYIDNTVWALNKIIGYNPLSPTPTKVELIRVQDINNYISQDYIAGNLTITRDGAPIYDASNSEHSSNPVVIRVKDDVTNIRLVVTSFITDWSIDGNDLDSNVSVSHLSGAAEKEISVSITIPLNITGTSQLYEIPIQWGSTLTIIQIVSISNWTVTAISNVGTATINDEPSPLSVSDGTNVTFDCTGVEGYNIGYWFIDGTYRYNNPVSMPINNDVTAEAYWYDASQYVMLTCNDIPTTISNESKIDNYWLLTPGNTYTFKNSQYNLSGYHFGDDTEFTLPSNSVNRTISSTDTLLTVYYDALLANIKVINNSKTSFDLSNIVVSYPNGSSASSVSGNAEARETTHKLYSMASTTFGRYSIAVKQSENYKSEIDLTSWNYARGSAIPTIVITIEDADPLGWEESSITTYGTSVTNYLYVPAGSTFQVTSNLPGVDIAPGVGIESQNITFVLPENNTGSERTITVTAIVNGTAHTFRIIQCMPAYLNIEPEYIALTYDENMYSIVVSSNAPWTASIPSMYSTYVSATPLTGNGNETVYVTVSENTGPISRTGNIIFVTKTGINDSSVTHIIGQDWKS